jgi:signal transduction histidine kinase
MADDRTRATSIRFRITALATAVVVGVLAMAAVVLVLEQRRQLTASLDRSLTQRADDIEALLGRSSLPSAVGAEGQETFIQLIAGDGTVLVASPPSMQAPLAGPGRDAGDTTETRRDLPIDDDTYRVLTREVELATGPATLVLGASLDEVLEGVNVLATSLTLVVPAMAAILAAMVWILVGRTLASVEAIRAEVADIGAGELSRRVPVPEVDDEVGRLAVTMNEMLERLDRAAARQRRFVADASHELRTPLARIRTTAEVGLAETGSDHLRAVLEDIASETIQMQRLIENLLYLARSDETAVKTDHEPVDLDDVVLEERRRFAPSTVTIDSSGVSGGVIIGDRAQLGRAVRNLMENAIRHATSSVALSVREDPGAVHVLIDDDGPGIPREQRELVFDRFARLDGDRSRDRGGTGLGLAISHDIVTRHRGTIEVEASPLGGARFVLTFPSAG